MCVCEEVWLPLGEAGPFGTTGWSVSLVSFVVWVITSKYAMHSIDAWHTKYGNLYKRINIRHGLVDF